MNQNPSIIPSVTPVTTLESASEEEQKEIQAYLAYHLEAARRMSAMDFMKALHDANIH